MDNLQFLQAILQLGWPAIVLIQCFVLYKDNIKMREQLIQVLKDREVTENPESIGNSHQGSD